MSSLPRLGTIVVDASITIHALMPITSGKALAQFEQWQADSIQLRAPDIWYAEVVTAIRKAAFLRFITEAEGRELSHALPVFKVEVIPSDEDTCDSAYEWATRMGASKAYDSLYLALAQRLGVELWTADKRLANSARSIGVDWVKTVG